MSNNSTWLTKAEAAERLGVSSRSLERYAKKGRVVTGQRTFKHGTQLMFDAESVDVLKAELRKEPSDVVLSDQPTTSLAKLPDKGLSRQMVETFENLTTVLAELKQSLPEPGPLTLGLKEAAELAGFSRAYLLTAIHAGDLKAAKRAGKWNLKRRDIQDWVSKL